MAFSDKFRNILGKGSNPDPKAASPDATPVPEPRASVRPTPLPPKKTSKTMEEVEALIAQERKDADLRVQAIDKEMQAIRLSIEKMELTSKTSRESNQQTLLFLQQDAEREMKFLERKLQEDSALWNKQLAEREKAIEQTIRQGETEQLEKKTGYDKETESRDLALQRVEEALKEQEAKLAQERSAARAVVQNKEAEWTALKQELARRDQLLENELKEQDNQRRAAQELWQTRLKEVERQWAEKRKGWEEAMKAKEDERLRVQTAFQEREAAWRLEQDRRIQDMGRRQERAAEKVSALKAHLVRETQVWQTLTQNREEQLQQLKVKLLLSESEAKARTEQAQKNLQEAVANAAAQVQSVQHQMQTDQENWKKTIENKDVEMAAMQEQTRAKLRQLETEYTQRLQVLTDQKAELAQQVLKLEEQHKEDRTRHEQRMSDLLQEQSVLHANSQKRLEEFKKHFEAESAALQQQVAGFEKQKNDSAEVLEALRAQWEQQLAVKDAAIKDIFNSLAPQEADFKKRLGAEEDIFNRQLETLKARGRAIEREMLKVQENAERAEKEHLAVVASIENESKDKELGLRRRAAEQNERLTKRLEESRAALEAFLLAKSEEEKRVQNVLQTKEQERRQLTERLQQLPQLLEEALAKKRDEAAKETELYNQRLGQREQELSQAREDAKGIIQVKAAQLAALRQNLDQQIKETAAAFQAREQALEGERAAVDKQISAAQAEMQKIRVQWQTQIEKKEQEIIGLEESIQTQQTAQRQTLEKEQKALEQQWLPLEEKRQAIGDLLKKERVEHVENVQALEKQALETQARMQALAEKSKTEKFDLEKRYTEQRLQLKNRLEQLRSEQQVMVRAAEETMTQKTLNLEELQEQIRQQTALYETRRQDAIAQATVKARSLQDQIAKLQSELAAARERFPQECKAREATIAQLTKQFADDQAQYQAMVSRYDRALATLAKRGRVKEDKLHNALTELQDEWAKKISVKETAIAQLQAELLAKESERQGELDRLAKQFAEERFQLEKSKEELGWKLKDLNEVSERQLAGRQKEISFLQNEIARLQTQRDEQAAQKSSVFETEKKKWQAAVGALQKQIEDLHKTETATLSGKDQELQALVVQSKQRMKTLSEEFNQKVNSWRGTNDHLRAQIDQLKVQWNQAQSHWDVLKKEKADEIDGLKKNVVQWEGRIESDAKELERAHDQERQKAAQQLEKQEKEWQEVQDSFQHHLGEKDEVMAKSLDDIKRREAAAETQWQSALEEWQTEKQNLQAEKSRIEQESEALQRRSEQELRELEEAISNLRMEVSFKENQSNSQHERMQDQLEKDLQPMRERMNHLASQLEQERSGWDARLQAKDEDLRMLKTRLAWREKRLVDEMKRRDKEIEGLRKQAQDELQKVRKLFDQESRQLQQVLQEKRAQLKQLTDQENELTRSGSKYDSAFKKNMEERRKELDDHIKHLSAQLDDLKVHYEPLLKERDAEFQTLTHSIETKDAELTTRRDNAKQLADTLRHQIEEARELAQHQPTQTGPKSAVSWSSFESGVRLYQAGRWPDAIRSFQECIVRDPKWGAAYQYLALAYHAQGDDVLAAATAQRALEQDPSNPQLGSWVERLRTSLDTKKKAG